MELMATFWGLDLNSELVFVGDAGTTEARGPTRRYGVEVGARGQVYGPFYFNGSFTWTHAEFKDSGLAIPLAPELTAYAALLLRWPEGLSSQIANDLSRSEEPDGGSYGQSPIVARL